MSDDVRQLKSTAGMTSEQISDAVRRGDLDEYLRTPNTTAAQAARVDADQGARTTD